MSIVLSDYPLIPIYVRLMAENTSHRDPDKHCCTIGVQVPEGKLAQIEVLMTDINRRSDGDDMLSALRLLAHQRSVENDTFDRVIAEAWQVFGKDLPAFSDPVWRRRALTTPKL